MEKRWLPKPLPDTQTVAQLKNELGIGEVLVTLLVQRGITSFEEAKRFFRPDLSQLHDPFLMADMEAAVRRIGQAIEGQEKVLIYGDYDVDGTTSVSLMYLFLRELIEDLEYYIPDRFKEGYGVSVQGIEYARDNNFDLIISLDCGVKSVGLVKLAADYGIDFIICDHHEPGPELPPAVAVLDAKRKDCEYPYKELSGCGVGFKLCQALCMARDIPELKVLELLDFVCVSIACDIVQMDGENRALSYIGLNKLNEDPHPGIAVLLKKAFEKNPKKQYDISDVVFYAGPRINAAGRLKHAHGAVDLLIESDEEKAMTFANELHTTNETRKELEKGITESAIEQLESDPEFPSKRSTVVFNPDWSKGVIGIVASRLVEKFYKPSIVLTASEGKVVGSARSVGDFNVHDAIDACSDHLIQFGGHTHAAGLTMKPEQVEDFKNAFEEVVAATISERDLHPELEYDLEISLKQINTGFIKTLLQMGPFGPGNMNPIFLTRGVKDSGMSKLHGEHLAMNLWGPDGVIGAMAFFQSQHFDAVKAGKLFDICYHIDYPEFNGKHRIQLRIVDMKPSTA